MKYLGMFRSIAYSACAALLFGACAGELTEELDLAGDSTKADAQLEARALGDAASAFQRDLALHYAPVHHQDVDATGKYALGGKSDYITAIDFDGDLNARNNWDNAANAPLRAYGYFSVVETATHWFVVYAFFHPRDWTDIFFLYYLDQHENDLEGALVAIEKDGSTYGNLQAAITVSHADFFSYLPEGSPLRANEESVDGTLRFDGFSGGRHIVTAQEAKGHGLKAHPYFEIVGDGIVYYPSLTEAEVPEGNDDRSVRYGLIDIFGGGELWEQRFNTDLLEGPNGGFWSTVGKGGANVPWGWNDGDDNSPTGALANDPAEIMASYFGGWGEFSRTYTFNPYAGIGR